MVFGCLKAVVDKLSGDFGCAIFESSVLVESANEEQLVAYSARSFREVTIAPHFDRGHRLQTIGFGFYNQIEHMHKATTKMVDDFKAYIMKGFILFLVVRQAEFSEEVGADNRVRTGTPTRLHQNRTGLWF